MNFSKKNNLLIILGISLFSIALVFGYLNYIKPETVSKPLDVIDDNIIDKFNGFTGKVIESSIINFPVEMNKKSVEENIEIFPSAKADFVWTGNKTVEIEIKQEFEKDTDFFINISDKALDITGNKLDKKIVQQFRIDGIAKLDFITPDGEISDLTKNITVRFSKPIVSLTTLDNQPDCPIKIVPEIKGKCVWITTSTFQFRPEEGFPIGAKYNVSVPEGIETIAGDKTVNSEEVEIITPEFKILNGGNKGFKDKPLLVTFNADVSIEDFLNNFEISGISIEELDVEYLKVGSQIEGEKIEKKNIISIFPKTKDWGYGKSYSYIVKSGLKSIRGNVNIGTKYSNTFYIQKLLTSYGGFIYNDDTIEDIELPSNIRWSNNHNIINKVNPKIVLDFYEEIELDKNLFSATLEGGGNVSFDIKYAKKSGKIDGEQVIINDKKKIIVEFRTTNVSSLLFKIYTSKISVSEDEILKFTTKDYNEVLDFKFINYKKSCLVLKNDIGYGNYNYEKFRYNLETGKIKYIGQISKYSSDKDCEYQDGKYTYVLSTRLDPLTAYNLIIDKELLDRDNYPLSKKYYVNFETKEPLNEDKYVSVIDNRNFILVPKDINPLGIAIKTVNLDKISVKICEGDFDIENSDYIKNEECETKEVSINNLGFTTNFSVINLEEVFGKKFSKSLVSLKIEKLEKDKTKYELESKPNYRYSKNINYLRTNISLVFKINKDSKLWLSDFSTGDLLDNQIEKIAVYENKAEYSTFGKYVGEKKIFKNDIKFEAKKDGLYELSGNLRGYLLITLKSGEEILFNSNFSYSSSPNKTYIMTDRPIYKPGDKVMIKGIFRKETATHYELVTGIQHLYIKDSRYNNVVDENLELSSDSTIDYEFQLEPDAALGNYNINIGNSNVSFAVEEFEKPDFKVESESTKDTYLYGEEPEIKISAEYYIGTPLSNGPGSYNVSASDYNFDGGKTTGYNWGENVNYWRYWDYNRSSSSRNIQYNVSFSLDENGSRDILIDTSKTTKDKIYNVSSTVGDPNTKKIISANTSFKVLNSPVFVGLKYDKYYYDFGDTIKFDFVSVDIDGNKLGNQNIIFRVYKIDYKHDKNTYTTTKEEELLIEESTITNNEGIKLSEYKINDYGELRFEVELENKKYITTKTIYVSGTNLIRAPEQEHNLNIIKDKDLYEIGDTAEVIIQSPITGVKALVTVEKLDKVLFEEVIDIKSASQIYKLLIKKEYLPNFELKVFIIKPSSYGLISIRKLKNLRLEMIELEQELYKNTENIIQPYYISYDILYNGGFIPYNLVESKLDKKLLTKLSELKASEQKLMQEILPNYYSGTIPVKISLDTIKLSSEVKTDKDEYLPSDTSAIELTIVDSNGNPISGEAVISVVDEALLALKNNDKDIVNFFYGDKPNYIKTLFNMKDLIKRFEFTEEMLLEEKSDDKDYNYTIDGMQAGGIMMKSASMGASIMSESDSMSNESLSSPSVSSSPNATKLRTEFKDLAYYNGTVKVVDGKATVNIDKLPDNLTTWVVKGYVVTKDTKVGNFESTFKVKKTLNLLPSIPRFFVSGDVLEVSAVVINNSEESLEIKPSIDITNVEIIEKPEVLKISAKGQELIVWKVKVNAMNNDINWNSYFSDITLKVESGDLQDSLKVSKKIIPYSTPEYTFTNGSTYGLSYEEKINLPDYVDKTQGQIDISYGATILTSLLDNIENLASMPLDNFYRTVSALKKGAILKGLYEKAGRLDEFKQITVIDYNGVTHKLDDIINLRIKYIKDYQNRDGGMMVYDDCYPRNRNVSCSNFNLTGDFLDMVKVMNDNGYDINEEITNKAFNYYKKELERKIKEYEKQGSTYRNIETFYKIIGYEKDFIKEYVLSDRFINSDYEFNNISKLKIILLLQDIDAKNKVIPVYMKELRNKTIIEARGTFVPANRYAGNNIVSTSLALRVFIDDSEVEKLIIENLARWLLAQKRENGEFGSSYDSTEVLKAITDYIVYTKELDNVDFEAKGYLDYKEITSEIFNDKNKFSLKQESFKLKDYIKFGVDNSLGFEKIGEGKLYYDVGLRYFLPIEKIEARDEGIIVTRNYYDYLEYGESYKEECISPYWYGYNYGGYNYCNRVKIRNIEPVSSGNKGAMLVGEIEIIVPSERNNVIVNNFIPAGAEIVNTNLDTTSSEVKNITKEGNNNWYSGFLHIDIKDDRVLLFADHLYKGSYKYTYVIKLNHKGAYHHRPAVAEELKKPEIWGRSKGEIFEIK